MGEPKEVFIQITTLGGTNGMLFDFDRVRGMMRQAEEQNPSYDRLGFVFGMGALETWGIRMESPEETEARERRVAEEQRSREFALAAAYAKKYGFTLTKDE